MSHALVPVDVAAKKSASSGSPVEGQERATTSIVIPTPAKSGKPTATPTAPEKTVAPQVPTTKAPVKTGSPKSQPVPSVTVEKESDETDEPSDAETAESPATQATPGKKKQKKKKKKSSVAATWRTFETMVLPDDLPKIASSWGMSPSDPRVGLALREKRSFDYMNTLTVERRKVLREADITEPKDLSDQDWTERRKDRRITLTEADREELRKAWAMEPDTFAEALKGEPAYQYVGALSPANKRAVGVVDIRKLTALSEDDWAQRRRAKVGTLIDSDLVALATEWGIPRESDRFAAALATQASYDFVRGLTDDNNRRAADVATIKAAKTLKGPAWAALRRRSVTTMNDADRDAVVKSWGLEPDDWQADKAFADDAVYLWFSSLEGEQRAWISKAKFKAKKAPSEADIEAAKKQAATVAAKEAALAKKKARETAAKQRREAGAKDWADFQVDIRKQVEQRIKAEMPDYDWQKLVDAALGATGKRIDAHPNIDVTSEIKTTRSGITGTLDQEKKRRDVEAAAKGAPARLRTVSVIKKDVLADGALTVADFNSRVAKAWHDQRNPTDVKVWARWLSLKMFSDGGATPFVKLADVATPALHAHFTVDWPALTMPATVDDTTTADDLLDGLFDPTGKNKWDLPHVTLETGIERAPDQLALPHRYWSEIGTPASYELRFGAGSLRWDPTAHNETQIKDALDAAYTEILGVLRTRAQHILDQGGLT